MSHERSRMVFRVGDFSLDGYPDLIATVKTADGRIMPMVIENVDYDNGSFKRCVFDWIHIE